MTAPLLSALESNTCFARYRTVASVAPARRSCSGLLCAHEQQGDQDGESKHGPDATGCFWTPARTAAGAGTPWKSAARTKRCAAASKNERHSATYSGIRKGRTLPDPALSAVSSLFLADRLQ